MSFDEVNDCRGRDKLEVFREKVAKHRPDLAKDSEAVESLAESCSRTLCACITIQCRECSGSSRTTEAFEYLKSRGVSWRLGAVSLKWLQMPSMKH